MFVLIIDIWSYYLMKQPTIFWLNWKLFLFYSHVITVDFKMEAGYHSKADQKTVKNDIYVLDVIKPVSCVFMDNCYTCTMLK